MAKKATNSRRTSAADAGTAKPRRSSTGRTKSPDTTATAPEAQPASAPDASTPGASAPAAQAPSATGLAATAEAVGRSLGRTTAMLADLLPWTRGSDALDLLEHDHRRLEALLKQGVDTDPSALADRTALLDQLVRELRVHEQIEEKVLYPALKSHAEGKDIVLEGYQEHHVADVLVKELQELPPSDERWGAKLKVLKESLDHHIAEEEGEMFKTARSVLSREQLDEIGIRMEAMKEALQGQQPGDPSSSSIKRA